MAKDIIIPIDLESPDLRPIEKAQKVLEHLNKSNGKLTRLQSFKFLFYAFEVGRNQKMYSYVYRWFNFPLWPYYAIRRYFVRRWYKKVVSYLKEEYKEEYEQMIEELRTVKRVWVENE